MLLHFFTKLFFWCNSNQKAEKTSAKNNNRRRTENLKSQKRRKPVGVYELLRSAVLFVGEYKRGVRMNAGSIGWSESDRAAPLLPFCGSGGGGLVLDLCRIIAAALPAGLSCSGIVSGADTVIPSARCRHPMRRCPIFGGIFCRFCALSSAGFRFSGPAIASEWSNRRFAGSLCCWWCRYTLHHKPAANRVLERFTASEQLSTTA